MQNAERGSQFVVVLDRKTGEENPQEETPPNSKPLTMSEIIDQRNRKKQEHIFLPNGRRNFRH